MSVKNVFINFKYIYPNFVQYSVTYLDSRFDFSRLTLKTDKKGDQHLWKMMSKLMTRLLKKYGLPADLCPRLQLSRNRITLRYMLHKKYRDRDVAESSWREMVYDQVGQMATCTKYKQGRCAKCPFI